MKFIMFHVVSPKRETQNTEHTSKDERDISLDTKDKGERNKHHDSGQLLP